MDHTTNLDTVKLMAYLAITVICSTNSQMSVDHLGKSIHHKIIKYRSTHQNIIKYRSPYNNITKYQQLMLIILKLLT